MVSRFEAATPVLPVEDVTRAMNWYRSVLGFQVGWTWGSPPGLASVCRDGVSLNLARRGASACVGPARVYFGVTEVDAYYAQVLSAGAQITAPLADRQYRMRDFGLSDPDGNELHFGEPAGAQSM